MRSLQSEGDFYGVLRPVDTSEALQTKAIDRDTALLFLTLSDPLPLPLYVRNALGEQAGRTVAKLIADPRSGGAPLERRPGAGQSEPENNGLGTEGDTA